MVLFSPTSGEHKDIRTKKSSALSTAYPITSHKTTAAAKHTHSFRAVVGGKCIKPEDVHDRIGHQHSEVYIQPVRDSRSALLNGVGGIRPFRCRLMGILGMGVVPSLSRRLIPSLGERRGIRSLVLAGYYGRDRISDQGGMGGYGGFGWVGAERLSLSVTVRLRLSKMNVDMCCALRCSINKDKHGHLSLLIGSSSGSFKKIARGLRSFPLKQPVFIPNGISQSQLPKRPDKGWIISRSCPYQPDPLRASAISSQRSAARKKVA